jgi:hypothetical protein
MKRSRSIGAILLGVALLLGLSQIGGGADSTTVSFTALGSCSLSLDRTTVDFGNVGQADYSLGYKELSPAQTLTIDCNDEWMVNVRADGSTFTYTPPAGETIADPMKPSTELEWRSSSTDPDVLQTRGTYTGISTTDAQVAAGDDGDDIAVQMHFKLLVAHENDPPGDYGLQIIYTLTTD